MSTGARERRIVVYVWLATLVLLAVQYATHRGALVEPVGRGVWLAANAIGLLAGGAIGWWWWRRSGTFVPRRGEGDGVVLVAAPLLCLLLANYEARAAYEWLNFVGARAAPSERWMPVHIYTDQRARRAYVEAHPGARRINVRLDPPLMATLRGRPAGERACLRVPVETGRGGVVRVMLPGSFDPSWGVDRWAPCDANNRPLPVPVRL